jgi:hypothetical protein
MERACERQGFGVAQVAAEVGYESEAAFNRAAHDARRCASRSPNYDRDVGCGEVAVGGLATAAF